MALRRRYDDRGTAKSSGNYATATTTDFAADAEAGLNCLRLMKKFSKVGLLGHSEGGLIGYMLGSKGKTDFIVSLAGQLVRLIPCSWCGSTPWPVCRATTASW